eukprot:3749819-Rhodomonas_salina.1
MEGIEGSEVIEHGSHLWGVRHTVHLRWLGTVSLPQQLHVPNVAIEGLSSERGLARPTLQPLLRVDM